MKTKSITVLKVEPMKAPTVVQIPTDLDSLQKAVSEGCDHQGLIEIITIDNGVVILCNEEGKLLGLQGNRRLGNDILVGTFYVAGDNKRGNLCSLTEKQLDFWKSVFLEPEVFDEDDIKASIFFEVTDEWER